MLEPERYCVISPTNSIWSIANNMNTNRWNDFTFLVRFCSNVYHEHIMGICLVVFHFQKRLTYLDLIWFCSPHRYFCGASLSLRSCQRRVIATVTRSWDCFSRNVHFEAHCEVLRKENNAFTVVCTLRTWTLDGWADLSDLCLPKMNTHAVEDRRNVLHVESEWKCSYETSLLRQDAIRLAGDGVPL
jgi:hypothetical protein